MSRSRLFIVIAAAALSGLVLYSCGTQKKATRLERSRPVAKVSLPAADYLLPQIDTNTRKSDTLRITDLSGKEITLMRSAVDENGETVVLDRINPSVVTARFRNVAERHGKVDLEFDVTVPKEMQDPAWQLRYNPELHIMGDTLYLDRLIITGDKYRKAQLRGYQHYERFISKIITDTTRFVDVRNLEIFIERNLPNLYAFKRDSTEVPDELFQTYCGVSEQDAIDHYTSQYAIRINERRKQRMDEMYRRYVKAPIETDRVRLDTVLQSDKNTFTYRYRQTVDTRPGLRKIDLVLGGDIREQDKVIYNIPKCEPITYYISSLSAFLEDKTMYKTRVIERRVTANGSCYIEFGQALSDINPSLGQNAAETGRIKGYIRDLLRNEKFDLDSITISSWASPEGTLAYNSALSARRAASAAEYFRAYTSSYVDSLRRNEGVVYDENGRRVRKTYPSDLRFSSRSNGENWPMLDALIASDAVLTASQKARYGEIRLETDADARERIMSREGWYSDVRERLYPRLRLVNVDFYLHRRGMVKDTVHTTEVDSTYMRGLQAVRSNDYETAAALLAPYRDYNAAVAHVLCDHNQSALEILEPIRKKSARENYLLALVYSRIGRERDAVQCYVRSCEQDPTFVHRGNLDPEISSLIRAFGLNRSKSTD